MFGKISLKISKEIVNKIQIRLEKSGVKLQNDNEYVEYALKEYLKKENGHVSKPDEVSKIKDKLKKLGYL